MAAVRPEAPSPARLVILLGLTAAFFGLPLVDRLDWLGRRDWDQFTFRYETARLALVRDRQWPLWNPYANGGNVLLAHPDSPALSPWFVVVLTLGTAVGLRVQVVGAMALGAIGMALLLRRWGATTAGGYVAGVLLMMSSHFLLHIAEGHLEWCVLALVPWVVLALERAEHRSRWGVPAALLWASGLLWGSVYIVAVFTPTLGCWRLAEGVRQRSWRPAFTWPLVVGLALLMAAVKLAPQLEFVRRYPRETQADTLAPRALGAMFFDPRQAARYQATRDALIPEAYAFAQRASPAEIESFTRDARGFGMRWIWHEYGCYVTWLGWLMAAIGVAAFWKACWPLWLAATLALLVALGPAAPIDLWGLLQRLPLYGGLQVPSRFLAAWVFAVAAAAGLGLSWLERWARQSPQPWPTLFLRQGVPLAIAIELAGMSHRLLGDIFVCPPLELPRHEAFAHRYRENLFYEGVMASALAPILATHSGIGDGYENLSVTPGRLRLTSDPDYRGEVYLRLRHGTLRLAAWSMRQVDVETSVRQADWLVLQQNFDPGWQVAWHTADGQRGRAPAQRSPDGLVAFAIRPGITAVRFDYEPFTFVVGKWVSAATLLVSALACGLGTTRPPPPRVPTPDASVLERAGSHAFKSIYSFARVRSFAFVSTRFYLAGRGRS